MPLIFLSYRRGEHPTVTRSIHQHLSENYGQDVIFLAPTKMPPGKNVREHIRDIIDQCAVVLPIFGMPWLRRMTAFGRAGYGWSQPHDWVRVELEEALACQSVRVVPLLLDGIKVPPAHFLPDALKSLTYCPAIPVSAEALNEDMPKLIRELDRLIEGMALELPQTLSRDSDDEFMRRNQYRHGVRYCLKSNNGQFDSMDQIYLYMLRQHLQLTGETAQRIQVMVQQPSRLYADAVREFAAQQGKGAAASKTSTVPVGVLDGRASDYLWQLQHHLALSRWEALKIRHQVLEEWEDRCRS